MAETIMPSEAKQESVNELNSNIANMIDAGYHANGNAISFSLTHCIIMMRGSGNTHYLIGFVADVLQICSSDNHFDSDVSYSSGTLTLPTSGNYRYAIVKS